MKKRITCMMALLLGTCAWVYAITWPAPAPKTTTEVKEGTTYYLYHLGRKQMLTYGAKWGTHAILDSTDVAALPYRITSTGYGFTFYSEKAQNQGLLFRENSGTGVYTDYDNHSEASTYWAIEQNGNGSVHIKTDPNDYVWGSYGYKVSNGEDTYLLGWNPAAKDYTKEGADMGTNQSVYMLPPNTPRCETAWAFVTATDLARYSAQKALYATAQEAEKYGIDYSRYTATYNGSDTEAMNRAIEDLKAMIENQGEPIAADSVFFALTDSSTMIIPRKYIETWEEDKRYITLALKGDTTIVIAKSHILSQDSTYQGERPTFLSFKFNNKYNDQLFTDAIADIDSLNGRITASVGCIGKRLTPSFQLPEGAEAFVNGQRQYSKQSRLRFDKPVRYTVAYPRQYVYQIVKTQDEVWSNPETSDNQWLLTKVALTGNMLSTNAPNNQQNEGPASLLDGNHQTIFHSTWGSGTYSPLTWVDGGYYGDGLTQWPYLQFDLPTPLSRIKFEYTTRNSGNYALLGFILQGSVDGTTWHDIQTFTAEKDALPTTPDATYQSPVLNLGATYSHLRLQLTNSQRKNYLVLSEFALYDVAENPDYQQQEPTLISPAEYAKGFVPYGRDFEVVVDFLTDHPTSEYGVPRIDITFGDGQSWNSSMWIGRNGKTTYEEATISIDGGGVYPDMAETPVKVRGRGNSSWANSYNSKNPYRLKFEEKQKPLGMAKGKSWVLLSNKQTGSMTSNALAMKIADMVGSDGANHIVPVELYVNGHYRGSYNLTEKVGFSNNSIDLMDESNAALLELDSYFDETYKFRDANYNLPVNIKKPEFADTATVTNLLYADIRNAFNSLTSGLKTDPENASFDVQSVVRALLVNDLVRNEECMHPKSWFIYNPDILADSLWHLGPVWDFDWSFGYEASRNYFISGAESDLFSGMSSSNIGYSFFRQLLRGSDVVKRAYYQLWTDFINSGKLDELIEYCDDYFQYANASFVHNQDGVQSEEIYWGETYYSTGWGDGRNYATHTTNAKNWLTKRANYIYTHLETYDLGPDIIPEDEDYGQPDRVDVAELAQRPVNVYTINGILVRQQVPYAQFSQGLMPGIYIVDGKKIAIR